MRIKKKIMKKEIKIPDIAENVESGLVASILVSEGDEVSKDQSLIEVETDKATTDIPSPYDGTIIEIKINEGDEVKVNQVIMILETNEEREEKDDEGKREKEKGKREEGEEEEEEEGKRQKAKGKREKEEGKREEEEREKEKGKREKSGDKGQNEEGKSDEVDELREIPASPSVRRMAREKGVDLKEVEGSGPGNRITREDVESASQDGKKVEKETGALPDFSQWGTT